MNEKNKVPVRRWWMGWPAFFRILSGAAIVVLIWLIVAINMGMDLDDFAASGSVPLGIIAKSVAVFAGLVVLAFLAFWARLVPKWWMGWSNFCRVLYGAAVGVLIWLIVALQMGMDLDDFTASGSAPPGIVTKGAAVFGGLVVLAFLVFWTRLPLAWLFIRSWGLLRWLFSWRMIRRYLYGLAGVALVLALFYAEEDWRGKRDWEQYKRVAEAKGERFDLSSFVPPAVPDDQNFMFSPIVSNSCLFLLVRNEHGFEEESTNAGPQLDIRINARYDWKPWPTNDLQGNWQFGKRIDLKAFQTYYRAPANSNWRTNQYQNQYANRYRRAGRPRGRYLASPPNRIPEQVATNEFPVAPQPHSPVPEQVATNEFPVAPQPQSPVADVLLALSKYDSAIEELRQASRRSFFRFPLRYRPETTNGFSEPNLAPLDDCVWVLRLRAVAELENGQSEKAWEDVRLILYLANLARHEPWREEWRQRWRMRNINSALQPVWQGLVDHKWSDTQLTAIEKELAGFDFLSEYQYGVRSWCAEAIEEIDSMEQRRFHHFWALFYFGCDRDGNSLWRRVFNEDTLFTFMPKGWFYENDVAAARMARQSLQTDAEVDRRILSAEVAKRYDQARVNNFQHPSPCNFVAGNIYPYYGGEALSFAFAQSSLDRARVACALERHRLAEGEYPATLDALAPRFIEKLPHDIINDQPLHYRRTEDGRFLLYSVGWNGTDEGGIIVREKNRVHATLDKDQGDWVWPNPE